MNVIFAGLFIPAVVDTVFRYPNNFGPAAWILIKNLFLIAFSLLALILGVISSLVNIIKLSTVVVLRLMPLIWMSVVTLFNLTSDKSVILLSSQY